jgi:hypothetical protein
MDIFGPNNVARGGVVAMGLLHLPRQSCFVLDINEFCNKNICTRSKSLFKGAHRPFTEICTHLYPKAEFLATPLFGPLWISKTGNIRAIKLHFKTLMIKIQYKVFNTL